MIADGDADARTLARRIEMLGCSQRPRERLRGRFHGFFALRHADRRFGMDASSVHWVACTTKIGLDRNGYACWWLSVCRIHILLNFRKLKMIHF
jgi:hypothetical protein